MLSRLESMSSLFSVFWFKIIAYFLFRSHQCFPEARPVCVVTCFLFFNLIEPQPSIEPIIGICPYHLSLTHTQNAAAVGQLEWGGWMEMTSQEPAVTQGPLGGTSMPCGSRVNGIAAGLLIKHTDGTHYATHSDTHTAAAVLPYSATHSQR